LKSYAIHYKEKTDFGPMTKVNTKYSETLALLLVVALAPISVAFAQTTATEPSTGTTNATSDTGTTGTDGTTDTTTDTITEEQKRKEKLREELKKVKDKIVYKKKVVEKLHDKADNIRDKVTDRVRDRVIDRAPDVSYSGKTNGWAILGGTAFPSSIGISGQGYHQGGGNWKITAVGDLAVADRTAKIDLKGHVRGNMINLQGTGTLSDGTEFRMHLKGHYAPTGNTNEFAIAFTNSVIQYKDTGARMPLMQVGSVMVTPIAPVEPVPTTPAQ
jgi:hypothetical protein